MTTRTRPRMAAIVLAGALAVACGDPPRDPTGLAPSFDRDGGGRTVHWFSAWTTSHGARQTTPAMSGRTVRMILRPTISGNKLRVKLENTMGEAPVIFSGAYIGAAGSGAAVVPRSNKQLTFDKQDGLTLGPGEGAYSDPVHFHVEAFEKLALSLDVVSASDISTHVMGLTINYSAAGARAADASGDGYTPLPEIPALNSGQWPFYWVAALDVHSSETTGTIVLFGNSITDGQCSTRDANGVVQPNLHQRWGDVLSERLAALPKQERKAVANVGIAGNRILNGGNGPSALERVDRDVLDRAGATHVVFFEGTNDIAGGFTAAEVIAGTQEIIDRVHARGLEIIGVTVIPRGTTREGWSAPQEQHRLAVNAWIRTQANFDGLIDFDALLQGPIIPETGAVQIRAEFNCDDIHPNAAGYKAMGEAINLSLFEPVRKRHRSGDRHDR
jgi:lysophospholipase L1-like esterase